MKNLTLENLARVCHGSYCGNPESRNIEVKNIVSDSRQVQSGSLFVAIPGERVDGHAFIEDVIAKGALCILSQRDLGARPYPYIRVESSLQAVKDIAEFYLKGLEIPVVGITGSVGKTSAKEIIASVLSQKYRTLKTQGNFNNELGLPLTVFRLRPEHQIAVLEMGINHFGEMTRLARIARPDTCVITNIGPCHLEFLGSRDGVFKAKTEIFQYLNPDGQAILNGDDDKLIAVKEVHGRPPVFFGLNPDLDVWANCIQDKGLLGIQCRIHLQDISFPAQIPIPGRHMVYNALAAAAVGRHYGLSVEQIQQGIQNLEAVSGRMHMIRKGPLTVIDDCYNANPVSMKASLDVLKNTPGRKTAILGDMGELGEDELRLHWEVGLHAADCCLDLCVCVGKLSRHMAEAARQKNPQMETLHMESLEDLLKILPDVAQKGGAVLVKASHFMQFEKIVQNLTV